jgi:hypothetical protein
MLSRISQSAVCLLALTVVASAQVVTYSNGPLITHPGAGLGGADASVLEAGGTVFGSTSGPVNFRLADDFTVPCGEQWAVTSFRAFGYQTGSGITSTMTSGDYRIWVGQPGSPGATILHDHSATNQMTSTAFTNIYRVQNTSLTGNTRPIMSVDMNPNAIVLGPGTYWFDYRIAGSIVGGPFTPPISGTGTNPPLGNGLQAQIIAAGTAWIPASSGPSFVGFPFEVDYTLSTINCYTFTVTQTGPGSAITLENKGGLSSHVYLNPITFNQGTFPNGWLQGLDIPLGELFNEISLGAPFIGVLDGNGEAIFVVPAGILPAGVTFYTTSAFFAGLGALGTVPAFSYTTI